MTFAVVDYCVYRPLWMIAIEIYGPESVYRYTAVESPLL